MNIIVNIALMPDRNVVRNISTLTSTAKSAVDHFFVRLFSFIYYTPARAHTRFASLRSPVGLPA